MSRSALDRRAHEAAYWLTNACFPLWAEEGVGAAGLFVETLDLSHKANHSDTTRVRVQARQTYVFSEALKMRWKPERSQLLISQGVAAIALAQRSDGLIGRTLHTDGRGLADETADLYDTAFCLFALASAARVSDHPQKALDLARSILTALDTHMKAATGGYFETLPPPEARLQNPHMHLLEACLALHEVDPDGGHLKRAAELISLFLTRLTAGPGGLLGESFKSDWGPPDGDAASLVEPGHQFEWVWLAYAHAKLVGADMPPEARALYAFGLSGLDDEGRAVQEVHRTGEYIDASRRTWPQTEALKAHLAMFEATRDETHAALAASSFDVLLDEYLTPDGGWMDHFSVQGDIVATTMPASTGYHVVLALAELIRISRT